MMLATRAHITRFAYQTRNAPWKGIRPLDCWWWLQTHFLNGQKGGPCA